MEILVVLNDSLIIIKIAKVASKSESKLILQEAQIDQQFCEAQEATSSDSIFSSAIFNGTINIHLRKAG